MFQLLATCLGNLLRRKPILRSAFFRDLGLSFLLQIPQGPRRRKQKQERHFLKKKKTFFAAMMRQECKDQRMKEIICIHVSFQKLHAGVCMVYVNDSCILTAAWVVVARTSKMSGPRIRGMALSFTQSLRCNDFLGIEWYPVPPPSMPP